MFEELLSGGRLIDVALGVLVLELVVLVAWRARTQRGMRVMDLLGHLLAGGFLLAALAYDKRDGDPRIVLFLVALSFPAHMYDLVRRWRAAAD